MSESSTEETDTLIETKDKEEIIPKEILACNTSKEEVPNEKPESVTGKESPTETTGALVEAKDEGEIKAKEVSLTCNTTKEEVPNEKEEKVAGTTDPILDEEPNKKDLASVDITNKSKSPQNCALSEDVEVEKQIKDGEKSSPAQDTTQETGHNNEKLENLEDKTETTIEKVPQEIDTPTVAIDPTSTPLESSATEEDHCEKSDSHKDNLQTNAKKVSQAIDLPEKSEILAEIVDTNAEKANEQTDNSSENTTETIKPSSKSTLAEVNQEKDTETTSSPKATSLDGKDLSESTATCTKPSSQDEHAEHVTYTEDGSAIYTDPQTKYQYKWCTKANNWIPCDSNSSTTNPYENEHYKWCSVTEKWIPKKTQVTETEHYKWDPEKNEWIAKVKDPTTNTTSSEATTNPSEIVYDIDEDGQRIYTDKDGAVFFWDVDKNAWFPKIDDDFMARYQMSYGFIDNTSESLREKEKRELENKLQEEKELEKLVEEAKANEEASNDKQQGAKRKAQQEPPKWFDIDPLQNTKVYVSNLPLDITLDEFSEVMGKCGMIMRDPQTQKYKLKLYTEADGQIKGDGLCDYIKVESVDLALKILDEYELRGHKLRVQRAQFQMRGEYNPSLKPKRKKKDKEKLAKIKEKLFDWRPEKMRGERSKHEKTVIIKNLFHPELFEKEVQLILDYQNDLREECAKCGTVRKVVIYDRHSEGVAQINMSSPEEADLVIQMMQGRYFGKRQLTAEHWDGKTKYKVEETEEEVKKRLKTWDKYLETEENKKAVLQKTEQDLHKDDLPETDLDLQKDDLAKTEIDLQKDDLIETDLGLHQDDLEKDEQDIEKTINFENSEKSQQTQKVIETQILEEKSTEV